MTIDYSWLNVTTELERVRAIEALCQLGIMLAKDRPNLFKLQEVFGIISFLNISLLPINYEILKPMIERLQIED